MFSGFATRFTARMTALVLVASMLTGCAEFDKRGGFVAEIEDYVLFTAHTKSHRLFRSYILIGVLLAAARQGGHNQADKSAIEGNLKEALRVAFEAYSCLYQDRAGANARTAGLSASAWVTKATTDAAKVEFLTANLALPANCQFFDEKMSRLDYALYRLALSALFNERANAQLATLRDKLIGEIPVLSASAKAAIFTAKAANEATNVVDDLLNLSFSSMGPTLALLPLYRDALELNMWVVADSLNRNCNLQISADVTRLVSSDGTPALADMNVCQQRDYVFYILNGGSGKLPLWRNFTRHMNYAAPDIDAYAPHFMLVTRFIWRSCTNYLLKTECSSLLTEALKYAQEQSLQIDLYAHNSNVVRIDSAAIPSPTRMVRRPSSPPSQNTMTPLTGRESDPTGSISPPKPQGALPQPLDTGPMPRQ
jgi:hypothetical protein